MEPSDKWWDIVRDNIADVPSAPELAALAKVYRRVTVKVATQITYKGYQALTLTEPLLKARQAELALLLPENFVIHTDSLPMETDWLTRHQSIERGEAIPGWSRLFVYRANTATEVLPLAWQVVAAARDYNFLATELMTKLAFQLCDTPENFARDDEHWLQYASNGQMGEWGYYFHGWDCGFGNRQTRQVVQARQGAQNETGYGFGAFDPLFLADFCRTTPVHKPLTHAIRYDYVDWQRTLDILTHHGYLQAVTTITGRSVCVIPPRL